MNFFGSGGETTRNKTCSSIAILLLAFHVNFQIIAPEVRSEKNYSTKTSYKVVWRSEEKNSIGRLMKRPRDNEFLSHLTNNFDFKLVVDFSDSQATAN